MTPDLARIPRPVRFALFYGAFYLGFGAFLPFMPVWFESRGMSAEMVGLAVGAAMVGRVVAAPLGAAFADRALRRRDAVIGFSFAAFFLFLAHIPATNPWLIVALAALAGGAYTGVIPVIDSFAVREAARRRFAFGPPRAFGSATFILGNLGSGALVSALGGEVGLYWTLMGAGLAALAALLLPEGRRTVRPDGHPKPSLSDLSRVLAANGLPLAFIASALVQGSHGFYYAFSVIAWTGQGIPPYLTGPLWAIGVGAEIVFFWASARWLKGLSPTDMLMLGAGVSMLRWVFLAFAPPLWLLIPLQGLHAFSFGATYLGFLKFATDAAPERYGATTQALNSALSGGIVLAIASAVSGLAYAQFGAAGFAFMALPAGIGLFCAMLLSRTEKNTP
jgi:PPP family 3-phenylpropionic acid transporter